MKRLVTVLFILFPFFANAQKMPTDYFDQGLKYLNERKYAEAKEPFREIVAHHPHNIIYSRAFYNLGYIYYERREYDSAINIFKNILKSDFNDTEELGGSIMSEPYANYRHRASALLSDIYSAENLPDSALQYLILADTVYSYIHFCGNELEANRVEFAVKYSKLYQKLSDDDKAFSSLIPVVFARLSSNEAVIEQMKILLQKMKIKNLKRNLDRAINNIKTDISVINGKTYTNYYFIFLNNTFYAPDTFGFNSHRSRQGSIESIKNSSFYKMIASL